MKTKQEMEEELVKLLLARKECPPDNYWLKEKVEGMIVVLAWCLH